MEGLNFPLVSILIPVYNREDLIERTILSALNQTYRNIEVIVCDNCSTDNTFSIVANLSDMDNRVKLFRNSKNLGPVLNWRECLSNSTGEYAMFLWSDDYINHMFIESTYSLFDSEVAFVLSSYKIQKDEKCLHQSFFQSKKSYSIKEYLSSVLVYQRFDFPVSPASALFRKKDLENSFVIDILNDKGLDFTRFGAGNDLMFFLVTSVRYKSIRTSDRAVAYFSHHEGSLSVSNRLEEYYEFAKLQFIKEHYLELLRDFYSKHISKKLLGKDQVFKAKDFGIVVGFQFSYFPRRLLSLISYKLSVLIYPHHNFFNR